MRHCALLDRQVLMHCYKADEHVLLTRMQVGEDGENACTKFNVKSEYKPSVIQAPN